MTVRWARYFNRYGHVSGAVVGGLAAYRVVWDAGLREGPFRSIRRQAKHRLVVTNAKSSGGEG